MRLVDGGANRPSAKTGPRTKTGFSERDARTAGEIAAYFRQQLDRVDDPRLRKAIEASAARWTRVAKVTGLRFELTTSKDAS
jgi:hypothetical protein